MSRGLRRFLFPIRWLRGWTLRAYFLLLLVLVAGAASAAVIDVKNQAEQNGRDTAETDARFAARTAAKQLGDSVGLLRATVENLANNPRITQTFRTPKGCSLSYSGIGGPDRGHLDILRPDGSVACSSSARPGARPPAGYVGAKWLRRALTSPVFIAPTTDTATGAKVAIAAAPIPGRKGIVVGFADLTAAGPRLASLYDSRHSAEFLVTTGNGRTVVARSINPSRWIGAPLAGTAFARSAGKMERSDLNGTSRLYEAAPVPGVGWQFFVGEDKAAALSAANRLANRQLEIIITGLIAFLLVGGLVYRNLAAPIRRLSRMMGSTSANMLPTVLQASASGPAELISLTNAIGGMVSSIDRELSGRQRAEARMRSVTESYVRDIGHRKRAESELRLLAAIVDSSEDAIVGKTLEGTITSWNTGAERMYGYTAVEAVGRSIAMLAPPGQDDEVLGILARLRRGEPIRQFETVRQRKDGKPIEVSLTISPIRDGSDEILGASTIARDISERKRAETELSRSEEQYRLLFENNPNPMWIFEAESLRFLAVNEAAVRGYGYSHSEFMAMTVEDIRLPEDVARLHADLEVKDDPDEQGLSGARVWRHQRKDGSLLMVEIVSHDLSFAGREARVALSLDVTARVEAENAAHQSEIRYRELVENASDLIATVDLDHRLTSVNVAFADSLGYSRDELIGRPLSNFVPAESLADLERTYREKVRGKVQASTYEHDLITKDGRRIAVEVASRVIEEDGQPTGIQAICRDVTVRREAEQAHRLIAAIVESSDDAIVSRTLDGSVLSWNAGAERLFGYAAGEMIGRSIDVLVPAGSDELPTIFEQLQRGERVAPFETQRVHKDGRLMDVSSTIAPIRDEGGRIFAAAAISRDVSERKRDERALRQLAAIVESSDDAIISTGIGGVIRSWNRGAERLYGYSADEMIGRTASFLEPDERDGEISDVFERLRSGREVLNFETVRLRKDGTPIHVSLTASPIRDQSGEIVAASVIVRDIGERIALEGQLRQSQKMEAIGRLAGGIAHDFNNLLTVISGYSDVLLEGKDRASEPELGEIQAAAQRATILTAQLLAFSRQQVLQPHTINLNEVVDGITPMLTRLIGSDMELVVALDPSLHVVLADPNQIERVLLNLVINARDAMPSGGKLTIETNNAHLDADYVEAHEGATVGPHAMIAVTDTGVGMDADTIARAFEPFFTSRPLGVGTGLGLSTVHGIVKQSGGNIWVYSEAGKGSSFKVYLPASDKSVASPRQKGPEAEGPAGNETILIVEDEDAVRALTARVLEARGYSTLVADGPEAALRLVEENGTVVDLLLTDLVMPGMGGRELAKRIGERFPSLAVLFMSGYAGEAATRNGALETGGAFLQKPFSASQLARKIRDLLDGPDGLERESRSAAASTTRL
jgi:two-component system cell cycle sensor histidine kinase/response regulator CckA